MATLLGLSALSGAEFHQITPRYRISSLEGPQYLALLQGSQEMLSELPEVNGWA
jgi:hypothetical protein